MTKRGVHYIIMPSPPKCSLCNKIARYDGKLKTTGQWAYMCIKHYALFGQGLGLGVGQEIYKSQEEKDNDDEYNCTIAN